MTTVKEYNHFGTDLEEILQLQTSPIAVKMLVKKTEIPAGALRPKKDRKYHLAQCQAFAASRRDGITVAMLKEDHWCPAALMAYGMVPSPKGQNPTRMHPYECFDEGKYIGVLTAPLKTAAFKPDVIIVYPNTAQLRSLLMSFNAEEGAQVNGRYFPPSCAHAVVTPMQKGGYWVVVPDPGEWQRALCDEGEMMFALPADKLPVMMEGLNKSKDMQFAFKNHHYFMQGDFERPDFYKAMFKSWGLEDY
jgi:uncharacterized protein (DUF169 family)